MVLLALLVSATPGLSERLALERSAVEAGEVWRLLTGHLVHGRPRLAAIDLGALLLLGLALESRHPPILAATLLASAVLSSAAVYLLRPDLARYEGSSALSSGVLVALGLDLLVRGDSTRTRVVAAAALVGFAAKSVCEITGVWHSPATDPEAGVEVVWSAHLWGGLGGAVVALAGIAAGSSRSPTPPAQDRPRA